MINDEPQTPFLAVDLNLLDRNIARMAKVIIHDGKKNWRPHVKAIKTPAIAHKLIAAGAIGVTCAKLSEAEVMAAAGIQDILVANQIVSPAKLRHLARLNRQVRIISAVDDPKVVDELEAIACAEGVRVPVVVEVDVGLGRAGVVPGSAVVQLARHIEASRHLEFAGLMSWEGQTAHIRDAAEKEAKVRAAVDRLVQSAALCEQAGLAVKLVSCGGTGTYLITSRILGVTELQAGGGVFGDVRYRDEYGIAHDCALTIWSTVTSRPRADRIVCDAGWKAMARFPTLPEPVGLMDVAVGDIRMSAEHTTLDLKQPTTRPAIGDRLQFNVGYSDSTVFLHDVIVGMRNGAVETVWRLLARGRLQ